MFAYRPGIDEDDAVIYLLHRSLSHLESTGSTVRVMFFGFSSAFSTIQPSLLRGKMEGAGVDCPLAAWTTDYLTNRLQYVRLHDCESDVVVCSTGAPQGTVLSPFLLTLYTSDFSHNSDSCHLQKFSDDTAIAGRVSEGNELEDREGLDVEIVEEYKYLGVHLNNKLDWTHNTDALYKKGQMIFYAVVCWSCGSSERDRKRLNKLVRRAGSVLDCSLDSIEEPLLPPQVFAREVPPLEAEHSTSDTGLHPADASMALVNIRVASAVFLFLQLLNLLLRVRFRVTRRRPSQGPLWEAAEGRRGRSAARTKHHHKVA
ncbi:hypothetical protein D4764_07G0007950 [Takifugu flavidus]|uniref:Reverse transcriptase domain-containing protein n=1 Tax=Takifugu flavidus TaxID=433684 RepID=A0A5C6MSM3_9TELE|nr:hypothetical protein D4764_07G0007950 [Takifugu flavidus]